jgi:hypothetical protein
VPDAKYVPGGQYTVGAGVGAAVGMVEGNAVGATQAEDPNCPALYGQDEHAVEPAIE